MSRQEFINLIEENGLIVERLLSRIHQYPSQTIGYSRQQLIVLVDLMVSGKSKLKEIARRQGMPTPNLCIMFRKLESEGLVSRTIDASDQIDPKFGIYKQNFNTCGGTKCVNQNV